MPSLDMAWRPRTRTWCGRTDAGSTRAGSTTSILYLVAVLERCLVVEGLGQRLHLRFIELGRETRNRLGLERMLSALEVVGQPSNDRAVIHAVDQHQVSRLHAGFGRFNGTQTHGIELGMVKLPGVGFLVGGHPTFLKK